MKSVLLFLFGVFVFLTPHWIDALAKFAWRCAEKELRKIKDAQNE